MKKSFIKKFAVAAGAALTLAVGQAVAAPVFGINQAAGGGTFLGPQNVTGTQFNGNSSELLRFSNADNTVTVNTGFLTFASIFNENTSGTTLINSNSGAGTYGLYLIFNFVAQYASGAAAGTAGSNYTITSLNFTLYRDPNGDTSFTNADSSGVEATRNAGTFGDDVVLGFGGLANPGSAENVAGFNSGGGAFVNSLEFFAICTGAGTATVGGAPTPGADPLCASGAGNSYFASPVPFYPLAFDAFNNTGNSLGARVGNNLAITQATGVVSFQAVPEPSSVALFGIAALGLGLSARRRRKA